MATLPLSNDQNIYAIMNRMKWSQNEKAVARAAFELALKEELDDIIAKARAKAEKLKDPSELWELEEYLTNRRKEIDRKYDYRYSVLPMVLGTLVRQRRLTLKDLKGLNEEKLQTIRRAAKS